MFKIDDTYFIYVDELIYTIKKEADRQEQERRGNRNINDSWILLKSEIGAHSGDEVRHDD